MRKNAPGDPGQFVGQRNRQHIAVQPLFGGFNPGLEPVALPALGLDQHHPGRLHEQNSQVAIATPGYFSKDGTVPGRYLFGNEPQPGGKVTALGEHIPCADRGHHRAGDDGPDTGNTHQSTTTRVLARDGFDFVRQTLDPLVEPAPVTGQIFDNAHHARRQDIWWRGQDAR